MATYMKNKKILFRSFKNLDRPFSNQTVMPIEFLS